MPATCFQKLRSACCSALLPLLLAGCWGHPNEQPGSTGTAGGNLTVRTLAGNGVSGAADGTGGAARFSYPQGVAVDQQGNIYVADTGNQRIRKITPAGVVTTLAGSGDNGSADGAGTAARFANPIAIAVDAAGMVYVSDAGNNAIRKITPQGVVTTLAGSGMFGATDGLGTGARFNFPHGLAVSTRGDVYVADFSNNRIRKITPAGVVTTFAGSAIAGAADGVSAAATFNTPTGIAIDAQDNLYVGEYGNHLIRKITPAGGVTTLAGNGVAGNANGTGTAASFTSPVALAADRNGNVYVVASGSNQIRMISAAGVVSTFAGTSKAGADDGDPSKATFNFPAGIAVDAGGNVVVADTANNLIRRITRN